MDNRRELLNRYVSQPEDRILLGRILDLAGQAERRNYPVATRFLDPRQQTLASALLREAGVPFALFGGYEGAERRVAVLGEPNPTPELLERACGITLLQADTATEGLGHRDYLGALMGLQITRELIGDILVQEHGAQLLVCESCADFLQENLTGAGRARLTLRALPLSELRPAEQQGEELRVTVASPRLDAVLAAALPMSRTAAAEHIATGRVLVSSLVCQKPDRLLQEGDVITLRGTGRLLLEQIGGTTRKGRTVLTLQRFGR